MSASKHSAISVRQLITRRLSLLLVGGICGLCAIIFVFVRSSIVDQTDAMLAQLAWTEAHGNITEYDHGVHVHDTGIALPSLGTSKTAKYSLVFRDDGSIIASTSNVTPKVVDASWISPMPTSEHARFFDGHLEGTELRVAAVRATAPDGTSLVFATAVETQSIDRAVYRAVVPIFGTGLVVLLVMLWAFRRATAKVTSDLETVAEYSTLLSECFEHCEEHCPLSTEPLALKESQRIRATLSDLSARIEKYRLSRDVFISVAAHEIRTPLAALMAELEFATLRDRDKLELRASIESALRDAQRLEQLAERLLCLNQLSSLHDEDTVTLPEAARIAVSSLATDASDKGFTLELSDDDIGEQGPRVSRYLITLVLQNLLRNALEHSGGSRIVIAISEGEITVSDNGRGISDAMAQRLFEPFQREGENGHGLGLYIAERAMKEMGGQLAIHPSETGTSWSCRIFTRHSEGKTPLRPPAQAERSHRA